MRDQHKLNLSTDRAKALESHWRFSRAIEGRHMAEKITAPAAMRIAASNAAQDPLSSDCSITYATQRTFLTTLLHQRDHQRQPARRAARRSGDTHERYERAKPRAPRLCSFQYAPHRRCIVCYATAIAGASRYWASYSPRSPISDRGRSRYLCTARCHPC